MSARVLVVKDDEKGLSIFTLLLESYEYEVVQARDGYEGLEAAKQAQPDLILLDVLLPGLDGFELAEKLRSSPEFNHVPIFAVSSLPFLSNVGRALTVGCNEYIEKPIDPVVLIDKVKAYLEMVNQTATLGPVMIVGKHLS